MEQTFLVPLATSVCWGNDGSEYLEQCLDDASLSGGRFEWLNESVEVNGYTVKKIGPVFCFMAMVPKESAALLQIWGVPNFYDDGRSEDWTQAYLIDLWKPKG